MTTPDILTGTHKFMIAAGQNTQGGDFDRHSVRKLRRKLIEEEFKEFLKADDEDDLVEYIDALDDLIVVAHGAKLAMIGANLAEMTAAEVARSNLAKIVDGKVQKNEFGKVIKPAGWTPPDIKKILWQNGYVA